MSIRARGREKIERQVSETCLTSLIIKIQEGGIMKKIIVTLAFALIAPLAFAQTGSKGKRQEATTAEPITVTGTIVKMTTEEGAAASYQPTKTLVVREDSSNTPGTYVLKGPGHVVDKAGKVVHTGIKPGAPVRVYYINQGDSRMGDHL